MQDDDDPNSAIIGALDRRSRLDVIHDRLQLDKLDSVYYDIAILEDGLAEEAARLQLRAEADGDAPRLVNEQHGADEDDKEALRFPISPQGRVALPTYQRILNAIRLEPELLSDRSKLRQLRKENEAAPTNWRQNTKAAFRPPRGRDEKTDFIKLMHWFLGNRPALHDLFKHLPFPELAAKMLPAELLQRWGELEAYDVQVSSLRAILVDEKTPTQAKEYSRTWLAVCTADRGSHRDRVVARDLERWKRLKAMHAGAPNGACPIDISIDCWNILQLLPYAAWAWSTTPWGNSSRTSLRRVYHAHPAVKNACETVAARADWGDLVALPTGITWEDRLVAMAAGLDYSHQC
ncbi:hypothetical protein PRIC1_004650 [Phytophthora ramorum]